MPMKKSVSQHKNNIYYAQYFTQPGVSGSAKDHHSWRLTASTDVLQLAALR